MRREVSKIKDYRKIFSFFLNFIESVDHARVSIWLRYDRQGIRATTNLQEAAG